MIWCEKQCLGRRNLSEETTIFGKPVRCRPRSFFKAPRPPGIAPRHQSRGQAMRQIHHTVAANGEQPAANPQRQRDSSRRSRRGKHCVVVVEWLEDSGKCEHGLRKSGSLIAMSRDRLAAATSMSNRQQKASSAIKGRATANCRPFMDDSAMLNAGEYSTGHRDRTVARHGFESTPSAATARTGHRMRRPTAQTR